MRGHFPLRRDCCVDRSIRQHDRTTLYPVCPWQVLGFFWIVIVYGHCIREESRILLDDRQHLQCRIDLPSRVLLREQHRRRYALPSRKVQRVVGRVQPHELQNL